MVRILVTGASGLLGSTLAPLLVERGYNVFCLSRSPGANIQADLTDTGQAFRILDMVRPDVIINLAAMTNVDECEQQPHLAYLCNVRVVENLARWVGRKEKACHLIQISTDHVYNGPGLHGEDWVTPVNIYALSKYAGELAAMSVSHTILRTNFFGRSRCPHRSSFSDWLVGALSRRERIWVFNDVYFSPLSMDTLSEIIGRVVDQRPRGVFNLGCWEGASKADFAFSLASVLDLQTDTMIRSQSSEVCLPTIRPADMRMDCTRFEQTVGIRLPTLEQEINLMRSKYHDET